MQTAKIIKTTKIRRLHGCSIEYNGFEFRIYDAWDRFLGSEVSIRASKDTVREFVCNDDRIYEEYNVPASAKRLANYYKPKYFNR